MAEENESLSLDEEAQPAGGKKKLIIIIVAVLLTLIAAGAGAYFVFFSGDEEQPKEEVAAEVSEAKEEDPALSGVNYVPMPRPIVFNVMEGKRDRTVQIKVQLMVISSKNETLARKHIPLLEGTLVKVFSSASAQQLRRPEGRDELRATALQKLNEATTRLEGVALIHAVLFTGFVLQ